MQKWKFREDTMGDSRCKCKEKQSQAQERNNTSQVVEQVPQHRHRPTDTARTLLVHYRDSTLVWVYHSLWATLRFISLVCGVYPAIRHAFLSAVDHLPIISSSVGTVAVECWHSLLQQRRQKWTSFS